MHCGKLCWIAAVLVAFGLGCACADDNLGGLHKDNPSTNNNDPVCGNGVRKTGEACDTAIRADAPGACPTTCVPAGACPAPPFGQPVVEIRP